jgi:hypothetical protein
VFADALAPIAEVSSGVFDFPTPDTQHRQFIGASANAAFVRDGYRSAKSQGKSSFTIARQAQQNRGSRNFAARSRRSRVYIPFIAILKLPFKFDRS